MKKPGLVSRLYWTAFTLAEAALTWRLPYRSPQRLQKLQDRRVRQMVAHAWTHVPHYCQVMETRGLRPADIRGAADLHLLPLITSADLAADPVRFRSRQVANEPLLEIATSGTSGHSKQIAWDRKAVFRARAAGLRRRRVIHEILGKRNGIRQLTASRAGGTADDVRAFHNRHSWLPGGLEKAPPRLDPERSNAENIELINRVRPDVIRGFGAWIGALFRWARVKGQDVAAPRLIYHGGEQMPEADRMLLEREYGARVLTGYQACEALRIAWQCPEGRGLHIDSDHVAIRIVDENGQDLPPGERGRVVISNLTNRATLLLNYDIGDVAALGTEPCRCGRNLPMLESLEGRVDDMVRLPGGEFAHESVVLSRLYAVPGVLRLQLVQEKLDRFVLRVVYAGDEAESEIRRRLAAELTTALCGGPMEVDIEFTDGLPPTESGKFRSIISSVPP